MVAYLKLLIAKMKRERFGQSAERGRKTARPAGIAARGVLERTYDAPIARVFAAFSDPGARATAS
jgi:hypothetical protein